MKKYKVCFNFYLLIMYKMQLKILGVKVNIVHVVAAMIIGCVLGCHLVCGCATREGYATAGSALDYVMNKGVHNNKYDKKHDQVEMNGGGRLSPQVPMPEGQLFFYANNEQSGKCCDSSNVSGPGGCVCITAEQAKYLSSRGGNRSGSSEY